MFKSGLDTAGWLMITHILYYIKRNRKSKNIFHPGSDQEQQLSNSATPVFKSFTHFGGWYVTAQVTREEEFSFTCGTQTIVYNTDSDSTD